MSTQLQGNIRLVNMQEVKYSIVGRVAQSV